MEERKKLNRKRIEIMNKIAYKIKKKPHLVALFILILIFIVEDERISICVV